MKDMVCIVCPVGCRISVDEDSVLTKEVLMNSLEAGEQAYNNRREIYELHENR